MNSKILLSIKSKLKKHLKNKEILDIIVFGSAVKGKALPKDIDIALISNETLQIEIPNFHVSMLKPADFLKPISLVHTLFREGYSLKQNKPFTEVHKFSSKVLFKYDLLNLNPSTKVKIVNILRGNKEKGLVETNAGEWIAHQVFIVPVGNENIFEKFFLNQNVKYKKFFILMH